MNEYIRIEHHKINVLEDIFLHIPTAPGRAIAGDVEAKLLPFGFRKGENGQYTVSLPKNLESFTENWVAKVAVACCYQLRANVESSSESLKELKYLPDRVEYLHGLSAALKLSCTEGIIEDRTSGLFHQGFRWATAQSLKSTVRKDLYNLSWKDPYYPVTGKEVWTGDAPDHIKRWHALVMEACKTIKVLKPTNFAKSYEILAASTVKHAFAYEQRSVFSMEEALAMRDYIQPAKLKLDNFLRELQNNREHVINNFGPLYSAASKGITEYDAQIAAIAAKRASIIFRTSQKKGQEISRKGLSREDRLSRLGWEQQIAATNPTGLFGETRSEILFTRNLSAGGVLEMLKAWYQRVPNPRKDANPLIKNWYQGWVDFLVEEASFDEE